MHKLLKTIAVIAVSAGIIATAGIAYVCTSDYTYKQYLKTQDHNLGNSRIFYKLVTDPDGKILVKSVLPKNENATPKTGTVTQGGQTPGGQNPPPQNPPQNPPGPIVENGVIDFSTCPYGFCYTYMGWQKITSTTSLQYQLRKKYYPNGWDANNKNKCPSNAFDSEGFAKIEGRYVVATTSKMGSVGQYIDVYITNNSGQQIVLECIIGDVKSTKDSNYTEWGHKYDTQVSTIEFITNYATWYTNGVGSHANPGTAPCHSEWAGKITKIVQGQNVL